MHPRHTPRLVDPQTAESILSACTTQREDRITAFATMRADMDDVSLRSCHPSLRAAYLANATAYYDMKIGGLVL